MWWRNACVQRKKCPNIVSSFALEPSRVLHWECHLAGLYDRVALPLTDIGFCPPKKSRLPLHMYFVGACPQKPDSTRLAPYFQFCHQPPFTSTKTLRVWHYHLPAVTWQKKFAEKSWSHLTNIFSDFSNISCDLANICSYKYWGFRNIIKDIYPTKDYMMSTYLTEWGSIDENPSAGLSQASKWEKI